MECCKCRDPSAHSISIREGIVPDRNDNPKIQDKSRTRVIGFCGAHWLAFKEFLGLSN